MRAFQDMAEVAKAPPATTDDARAVLAEWAAALLKNNNGPVLRKGFDAILACAEWLDLYELEDA